MFWTNIYTCKTKYPKQDTQAYQHYRNISLAHLWLIHTTSSTATQETIILISITIDSFSLSLNFR